LKQGGSERSRGEKRQGAKASRENICLVDSFCPKLKQRIRGKRNREVESKVC